MKLKTEFPIELTSDDGLIMVELDWDGEGDCGDYDESDPTDTPLLRYTLFRKYQNGVDDEKFGDLCDTCDYDHDEWGAVRDGSYCTGIDARLTQDKIEEKAKEILSHVYSGLRNLNRQKRLYERLSHIS